MTEAVVSGQWPEKTKVQKNNLRRFAQSAAIDLWVYWPLTTGH